FLGGPLKSKRTPVQTAPLSLCSDDLPIPVPLKSLSDPTARMPIEQILGRPGLGPDDTPLIQSCAEFHQSPCASFPTLPPSANTAPKQPPATRSTKQTAPSAPSTARTTATSTSTASFASSPPLGD